jgi:hypothetical protein
MTSPTLFDASRIAKFTPEQREQALQMIASYRPKMWAPLKGPQTMAFESTADVIGYGGAAGGGKTDLMCGKMLTQHQTGLILRREATQLVGIIDRFTQLLKGREGFNGQDKIWRLKGKQIEFGSTPNVDDWNKYQGRPHDFLGFDETANFLESQVRALLGWLRSVDPHQKCQALLCFNPPTSADGRWIIAFFAPWLDKKYAGKRAQPGELRYFAMVNGKEIEVEDKRPFVLVDGKRIYDFDPADFDPTLVINPMSRTFIPSRVSDNPYLVGTGYMAQLQSLPEPLRSQMLYGDFNAGVKDDPWQVIPTRWVELAMERWKPKDIKAPMDSLGIDVARGGDDSTQIARLHEDNWYDELLSYPGKETPDGYAVAGLVVSASRDDATQHIDVIGVGASPYDVLNNAKQPIVGVNVSEAATALDMSGRLRFKNQRSQYWWQMREALDPSSNQGYALPPDPELLVELCAPRWELQGSIIYVESREDIVARIKRSPDKATAVILARIRTPKVRKITSTHNGQTNTYYDPYANLT